MWVVIVHDEYDHETFYVHGPFGTEREAIDYAKRQKSDSYPKEVTAV